MGNRLGVIAGSGQFPIIILKEAQKSGYKCIIAGVRGEAEDRLRDMVEVFEWFDVDEISRLISFFKRAGIREAVFAGKVDHRVIYKKEKLGRNSFLSGEQVDTRTPTALLEKVIETMAQEGIKIKNPMLFLSSFVCEEGVLTKTKPSPALEEDAAFGWEMAKNIADLDIGQTVVVKDKAVVAVEGMEGTDEAIKRGGRLAGEGTVVIKVTRTSQDFRIDLPAIGLNTVESLIEARSKALCFEAQKMPFFQKDEAISLADTHKISIIARKF